MDCKHNKKLYHYKPFLFLKTIRTSFTYLPKKVIPLHNNFKRKTTWILI